MLTLKQLRELVAAQRPEDDHLEVKVWLPGSTLSLEGKMLRPDRGALLIEGNLDPGSALMRD